MTKKRKSRLQKVQNRKAARSAFFYIVLCLLGVYFLIEFGVPAASKLAIFLKSYASQETGVSLQDSKIPPAPPKIEEIPRFVNEKEIKIEGFTAPGNEVAVYVNEDKYDVVANAEGKFSQRVSISEDKENVVYAISKSKSGVLSRESEKFTIIFDNEPPEIEVISPKESEIYGRSNQSLKIEGQTDPDAQLKINGRVVIVQNDGKFSENFQLESGENVFKFEAVDSAGNKTEIEKTIRFLY